MTMVEAGPFDVLGNEEEGARTGLFMQMEKLRLRDDVVSLAVTQQASWPGFSPGLGPEVRSVLLPQTLLQ